MQIIIRKYRNLLIRIHRTIKKETFTLNVAILAFLFSEILDLLDINWRHLTNIVKILKNFLLYTETLIAGTIKFLSLKLSTNKLKHTLRYYIDIII